VAGGLILFTLIAVCYATLALLCTHRTGGRFVYGLDDPYIHLSIARNFAMHGIWGVTPYAHSASNSSPLWGLLLAAAIRIGGDSVYWPLGFGILASVSATLLVYYRFVLAGLRTSVAIAAAAGVFAIAPLHLLPFIGMEHCLQILLDILFLFWVSDSLGRINRASDAGIGLILTLLMCLCRYESVCLIVVPFGVLLWRRDWLSALCLGLGPIVAIGGFGLCSHSVGMPWVPNSIVLKGSVHHSISPAFFRMVYLHIRARSLAFSDLFLLCVLSGIGLRLKGLRSTTSPLQVMIWTVIFAGVCHATFASIGPFYRYEAYLMSLMLIAAILSLREFLAYSGPSEAVEVTRRQWIGSIFAVTIGQCLLTSVLWIYNLNANLVVSLYVVGLIGLFAMEYGPRTRGRLLRLYLGSVTILALYFIARSRAVPGFVEIQGATGDTYLQQFQIARFVKRTYPTGRIALNDIGAVTYYAPVRILDLMGLASDEVRQARLAGKWNAGAIAEQLAKFRPDLVVVYPEWFQGDRALPPSLVPIVTWTIPPVTSVGRAKVEFYAPTAEAAARLRRQLIEFQPTLPSEVKVEYVP
jgi:hypothetical protein